MTKGVVINHADCIPVRGDQNAIIYDLTRKDYEYVPLEIVDFIDDIHGKCITSVKVEYDWEIYGEWFDFLIEKEFIDIIPESVFSNFRPLSIEYESPYPIENVVLDVTESLCQEIELVAKRLDLLNVPFLQIRNFDGLREDTVLRIVNAFEKTSVKMIELFIKYEKEPFRMQRLMTGNQRVRLVVVHSSAQDKVIKGNGLFGHIVYSTQVATQAGDCINFSPEYFTVNHRLFIESQRFNTYYNRKLCINEIGELKNCNSLDKSYGNIFDSVDLRSVVESLEFRKLWTLNKDSLDTCKGCAHRYMCTFHPTEDRECSLMRRIED